jgi:hypothetical protein
VLYSLHVCVWARQIQQLRLTIPNSFARCVMCVECFPRGVSGGARCAPPSYAKRLGQHPQIFLGVVFAILADFSIFNSFLN